MASVLISVILARDSNLGWWRKGNDAKVILATRSVCQVYENQVRKKVWSRKISSLQNTFTQQFNDVAGFNVAALINNLPIIIIIHYYYQSFPIVLHPSLTIFYRSSDDSNDIFSSVSVSPGPPPPPPPPCLKLSLGP